MLLCLLLAAPAGFAQFAYAIAFPGPAPTPAKVHKKIAARGPEPTAAPWLDLRATQWTNTCAFDGDGDAISCSSGYSCVYYEPGGTTSIPGMAGCVSDNDFGDGEFARSCIDYNHISSSSLCDAACWQNSFIQKCTDKASPYCLSTTYVGVNIQDFSCDTDGASTFSSAYTSSVATLSNGNLSTLVLQNQVITGSALTGWQNLSSSVAGATSSTATDNTIAGKGQPASTTSSSSPTTSPLQVTSSGSKSDVGAIVGGTVGGVVGGLLIAAAAFFLWQRSKKRSKSMPPTYSQVPGAAGDTAGGAAEGGAAGYYAEKNIGPAHEMSTNNERVEADGGNVIYKKEGEVQGQELASVKSPVEAPSEPASPQVHEIGPSK